MSKVKIKSDGVLWLVSYDNISRHYLRSPNNPYLWDEGVIAAMAGELVELRQYRRLKDKAYRDLFAECERLRELINERATA